jgi:hypothetical protein
MPKSALRLLAGDTDDLAIIAAACQDGVVRMGDFSYDRTQRRFTLVMARFRWETARKRGPYERIRAALSFESVLRVRPRRLRTDAPDAVAALLTMTFEPGEISPAGLVRMTLAGGGDIALEVECLDVVLADMGAAWPTPHRPNHDRS